MLKGKCEGRIIVHKFILQRDSHDCSKEAPIRHYIYIMYKLIDKAIVFKIYSIDEFVLLKLTMHFKIELKISAGILAGKEHHVQCR